MYNSRTLRLRRGAYPCEQMRTKLYARMYACLDNIEKYAGEVIDYVVVNSGHIDDEAVAKAVVAGALGEISGSVDGYDAIVAVSS